MRFHIFAEAQPPVTPGTVTPGGIPVQFRATALQKTWALLGPTLPNSRTQTHRLALCPGCGPGGPSPDHCHQP